MHLGPNCDDPHGEVPNRGILHLRVSGPAGAFETLKRALLSQGLAMTDAPTGMFAEVRGPEVLRALAATLPGLLSSTQLEAVKSELLEEDQPPSPTDLARMESLASLLNRVEVDGLREMIRQDRLITHFQPIVCGHDPTRVFAHECLLRGVNTDGGLVPPDQLYASARKGQWMAELDRAARLRAIRSAVESLPGGRIFVNFNPTSLVKPSCCLKSTIDAIERAAIPPERIVFEVVESDRATLDLSETLSVYRDAGFRVALDNLGGGYGSLNLLSTLKPDFVKIDMKLIRDVDSDPYKAGVIRRIVEMAQGLGISTVAEGVETEAELAWVEEQDIDFVQGYLIARPACPPPLPQVVGPRLARRRVAVEIP